MHPAGYVCTALLGADSPCVWLGSSCGVIHVDSHACYYADAADVASSQAWPAKTGYTSSSQLAYLETTHVLRRPLFCQPRCLFSVNLLGEHHAQQCWLYVMLEGSAWHGGLGLAWCELL